MTTHAKNPPDRPSEEGTAEGMRLAKEEGEVYGKAVTHMTTVVAHGEEKRAGEYIIGYAVEKAEGMYYRLDGNLEWREPAQENARIEVVVRDAADGRFLPGLTVHAALQDAQGNSAGLRRLPFLWHPSLFHYGTDWTVPGEGEYTLRVYVDVPDFPRHDRVNGKRYADPVQAEFTGVKIETDQG
jgi:hypothetical protein